MNLELVFLRFEVANGLLPVGGKDVLVLARQPLVNLQCIMSVDVDRGLVAGQDERQVVTHIGPRSSIELCRGVALGGKLWQMSICMRPVVGGYYNSRPGKHLRCAHARSAYMRLEMRNGSCEGTGLTIVTTLARVVNRWATVLLPMRRT